MQMKKEGPYEAITHDVVRDDGYRILISGAYNALGLIGSEYNGIVVLDEKDKTVVTDCIGRQSSGWYYGQDTGPGKALVKLFEDLQYASPEAFADRVNTLGVARACQRAEDRTQEVVAEMVKTVEKVGLDTAFDVIADALHEMADREGIPEGEERDAWRRQMMEATYVTPRADEEDLAVILVNFGATRAQVEEAATFRAPAASDDEGIRHDG